MLKGKVYSGKTVKGDRESVEVREDPDHKDRHTDMVLSNVF